MKERKVTFIDDLCLSIESTAELDWFQFETEMRKVIRDLIDPTIQRSHEDRERTNNYKIILDTYEERLNYMENLILRNGEKLTVFEDIKDRIATHE